MMKLPLDRIPFHMPGHKRNTQLLGDALPYAMDLTEIDGADNLLNPTGILLREQERAAKCFGSVRTYFSVNGCTGAILAGIRAMTHRGDTVLVARNCHMSVYHAIELCGLTPVYLRPEWIPELGVYGAVSQEVLNRALAQHPEATLCVYTSPTYEGVVSDVTCSIPVLVDAAHSASLPLPNADLVIQSFHKTLPGLTQTALIHVYGDRIKSERLEHQLRVFQTSSPSYVLLQSISAALDVLEQQKETLWDKWEERLEKFRKETETVQRLVFFWGTETRDQGKILVLCHAAEAAAYLRNQGIEPEYARGNVLLLWTSPCDTDEAMAALTAALKAYDAVASPAPDPAKEPVWGERIQSAEAALEEPQGGVYKAYVWGYPPGIPLCVPGERRNEFDPCSEPDDERCVS